jgi:hypothetical protein
VPVQTDFSWPPLFFIPAVMALAAFSFWMYHRSRSPASRGWRLLLTVLRSAAFFLILIVLFQTVIRFSMQIQKKAEIAVLLDDSASMKTVDAGSSRKRELEILLDSKPFREFQNRFTLRWFLFSDTLCSLAEKPDTVASNGNATNLSRALEQVSLVRPDAVLVMSDGIFNTGKNPVHSAKANGLSLFCLALGNASEKTDAAVSNVQTNELAYAGNSTPVRISLRGPGFGGRTADVLLRSEKQNMDRARVVIPEDGMEASVTLHYRFDAPGFHKLTVSVQPFRGEASTVNNTRETMVRVLQNKMKVLLLADAPSPDLAFVKRALSSDSTVDAVVRTFRNGSEFYEGRFPDAGELDRTDAFWLLDVPGRYFPENAWQNVAAAILKGEKSVFWILGKDMPRERMQSLDPFLPVQFGASAPERSMVPSITDEGRSHPFLQMSGQAGLDRLELPPIFSIWMSSRVRPGAKVLIEASPEKPDNENTVKQPLLIVQNTGGRKSAAILGRGIFRWQLMLSGRDKSADVFKTWMGNAVRWLGAREGARTVRLHAARTIVRAGEENVLSVQVYNESLEPVEGAEVKVRFLEPEGENEQRLAEEGNGVYGAVFRPLQSGRYRAEAQAVWKGRLLGKDTTEFAVSPFQPEFLDTRARPDALAVLADETGGRSGPPDSLEAVLNSIRFPEKTVTLKREWNFAFRPFMLAAILILLSAEWFIRRRKGML